MNRNEMIQQINSIAAKQLRRQIRIEDRGPGLRLLLKRVVHNPTVYGRRALLRFGLVKKEDQNVTLFWGKTLVLPNNDADTQSLQKYGILDNAEHPLIKYLIKTLTDNDIFYDIGANFGFYTALAQELIRQGEVHSFEPSPSVFPYLQQLGARSTYLNNCAVAAVDGTLSFFDAGVQHQSGKSTINADVARENVSQANTVSVSAVTLDTYIQTHRFPTYIKIDVEGGELSVLRGAETVLRAASVIAIELWSGKRSSYSQPVLTYLIERGYKPYTIDQHGELHAIAIADLSALLTQHTDAINFIFKKE